MKQISISAILVSLAALSLVVVRSVAPQLFTNQLVFFCMAAGVYFVTSKLKFDWWQKQSYWLYAGLVAGLLLTYLFGSITRGSARWIAIGSIHIQPSQLSVPIVALFLSNLVKYFPIHTLKGLSIFVVGTLVPAILILIEPDLGSTIIFLFSLSVFVFFSQIHIKYLASLFLLGLVTIIVSWSALLQPYQKQRVTSFLSPTQDIQGAGYNAQQALIAVGAGGTIGKGLGRGIQSHLRFLPERQTDFIFASLAEELGFAGSILVLMLYLGLLYLIISSTQQLLGGTSQLFLYSIAAMLLIQTTINIGMNMGLFPITGITLPFISYGGSSILSLGFSFGLVVSAIRQSKKFESLHIN